MNANINVVEILDNINISKKNLTMTYIQIINKNNLA